jgi:hypothetical protein
MPALAFRPPRLRVRSLRTWPFRRPAVPVEGSVAADMADEERAVARLDVSAAALAKTEAFGPLAPSSGVHPPGSTAHSRQTFAATTQVMRYRSRTARFRKGGF